MAANHIQLLNFMHVQLSSEVCILIGRIIFAMNFTKDNEYRLS